MEPTRCDLYLVNNESERYYVFTSRGEAPPSKGELVLPRATQMEIYEYIYTHAEPPNEWEKGYLETRFPERAAVYERMEEARKR